MEWRRSLTIVPNVDRLFQSFHDRRWMITHDSKFHSSVMERKVDLYSRIWKIQVWNFVGRNGENRTARC